MEAVMSYVSIKLDISITGGVVPPRRQDTDTTDTGQADEEVRSLSAKCRVQKFE